MSKTPITKMQRLQTVLDCYGAHVSRWPARDHDLMAFVKDDRQAEQLYLEAKALDLVLDLSSPSQSPVQSVELADQEALQARILVAFRDNHEERRSVVVDFPGPQNHSFMGVLAETGWVSALLLAACFVFGIYLGGFGVGDWTLDPTTSFASLSIGGAQPAEIADYVLSSGFEEDLL